MPRPKGYSPGLHRRVTHTNGDWSWNTQTLNARIERKEPDECWTWKGSQGPQANLFGAYKRNYSQMTQANRLIYAEANPDANLNEIEIRMSCQQKYCCNPAHMTALKKKSRSERSTKLKAPAPTQRKNKRIEHKYLVTISEHIFAQLEVEERFELRSLLQEFAYDAGTSYEFEYRWFKISKEKHLLATIKYPNIQKYLTVKEI